MKNSSISLSTLRSSLQHLINVSNRAMTHCKLGFLYCGLHNNEPYFQIFELSSGEVATVGNFEHCMSFMTGVCYSSKIFKK